MNTNKKNILLAVAVMLALFILILALEKTRTTDFVKSPFDRQSEGGPTVEELQKESEANAQTKRGFVEGQKGDQTTPSTSHHINKSIDMSTKQESNNTVTVFTKIYGYSAGDCILDIKNGTRSHTQNATLMYQPEHSTCSGFSVPIEQLGTGTWMISLTIKSYGAIETKTISSEVK